MCVYVLCVMLLVHYIIFSTKMIRPYTVTAPLTVSAQRLRTENRLLKQRIETLEKVRDDL